MNDCCHYAIARFVAISLIVTTILGFTWAFGYNVGWDKGWESHREFVK